MGTPSAPTDLSAYAQSIGKTFVPATPTPDPHAAISSWAQSQGKQFIPATPQQSQDAQSTLSQWAQTQGKTFVPAPAPKLPGATFRPPSTPSSDEPDPYGIMPVASKLQGTVCGVDGCALTAGRVLRSAGLPSPTTANARDFVAQVQKMGFTMSGTPQVGDVVSMRGTGPSGVHVGIYTGNGQMINDPGRSSDYKATYSPIPGDAKFYHYDAANAPNMINGLPAPNPARLAANKAQMQVGMKQNRESRQDPGQVARQAFLPALGQHLAQLGEGAVQPLKDIYNASAFSDPATNTLTGAPTPQQQAQYNQVHTAAQKQLPQDIAGYVGAEKGGILANAFNAEIGTIKQSVGKNPLLTVAAAPLVLANAYANGIKAGGATIKQEHDADPVGFWSNLALNAGLMALPELRGLGNAARAAKIADIAKGAEAIHAQGTEAAPTIPSGITPESQSEGVAPRSGEKPEAQIEPTLTAQGNPIPNPVAEPVHIPTIPQSPVHDYIRANPTATPEQVVKATGAPIETVTKAISEVRPPIPAGHARTANDIAQAGVRAGLIKPADVPATIYNVQSRANTWATEAPGRQPEQFFAQIPLRVQNDAFQSAIAKPEPGESAPVIASPGVEPVKPVAQEVEGTNPGNVAKIPTSSITADPARFQYKVVHGATGATSESTASGASVWRPSSAGFIDVWKDPADGKTYVVNGHNRLALANRLGVKDVNVHYIDKPDAAGARSEGALDNIASGQGTAVDAAQFFRDSSMTAQQLADTGVSIKGRLARDGRALANLNPTLFSAVRQGYLPEDIGIAIGSKVHDSNAQTVLAKQLDTAQKRGKTIDPGYVSELADQINNAPTTTTENTNLFGTDEITQNLAIERADVAKYLTKTLASDTRHFQSAINNKARLERAEGNAVDVANSAAIVRESRTGSALFAGSKNAPGAVSDLLNEAATRIAKGENPNVVKQDTLKKFIALAPELTGKANPVDAGIAPSGTAAHSEPSGNLEAGQQPLFQRVNPDERGDLNRLKPVELPGLKLAESRKNAGQTLNLSGIPDDADAEYHYAKTAYSKASSTLAQATLDYRARKIGDNEYLAARHADEVAKSALDVAESKYIKLQRSRAQNLRTPSVAKPKQLGMDLHEDEAKAPSGDKTGSLFQGSENAKGSITFTPEGTAVIRNLKGGDPTTLTHELFHWFRRTLSDDHSATLESHYGVTDHSWTENQEEAAARDYERFRATSQAPTPQLKPIFQRMREWFAKVYDGIKNSPIAGQLDPKVMRVFQEMHGETVEGGEPTFKAPEKPITTLSEPRKAGNLNLDRMDTSEDVKKGLEDYAKAHATEMEKSRRGVIPHSETLEKAKALGITVEQAMKGKPAGVKSSEWVAAVNDLMVKKREQIDEARKAWEKSPTPENAAAEDALRAEAETIVHATVGENAEAGRTLNILKALSSAARASESGAISDLYKTRAKPSPKAYGENNRFWTVDKGQAARERYMARLNQAAPTDTLHQSAEPTKPITAQDLHDLTEMGGVHVEAGLNKFPDWAAQMQHETGARVSDTDLMKVWNNIKIESSAREARAKVPRTDQAVLVDRLARTALGRQGCADFLNRVTHEDGTTPEFDKFARSEETTPQERQFLTNALKESLNTVKKTNVVARVVPRIDLAGLAKDARIQAKAERLVTQTPEEAKAETRKTLGKILSDDDRKAFHSELDSLDPTDNQGFMHVMRKYNRMSVGESLAGLVKAGFLSHISLLPKIEESHLGFNVAEELKRIPAATADMAYAALTGRDRSAMGLNIMAMGRAAREGIVKGLPQAYTLLKEGETGLALRGESQHISKGVDIPSEYNANFDINIKGFHSSALSKAANIYVNGVSRLHGAIYHINKVYGFVRAIDEQAQLAAKNESTKVVGETGSNQRKIQSDFYNQRYEYYRNNPTSMMIVNAARAADELVFQNPNRVAQAIEAGKGRMGPYKPLAEVTLPFMKVRSNVFAKQMEYTFGLLPGVVKLLRRDLLEKGFTEQQQRAWADNVGRGTIGAASVFGLADYLHNKHILFPGNPQYNQPTTLKIGNKYYPVSDKAPVGTLAALAAHKDEGGKDMYKNMIGDLTQDAPLLDNAQNAVSAVTNPGGAAGNFAEGLAIPGFVQDIAGHEDPDKRQVNFKDDQRRSFVSNIQQGVPKQVPGFNRQMLPSKGVRNYDPFDPQRGRSKPADPTSQAVKDYLSKRGMSIGKVGSR